jgi:hypothetical protein
MNTLVLGCWLTRRYWTTGYSATHRSWARHAASCCWFSQPQAPETATCSPEQRKHAAGLSMVPCARCVASGNRLSALPGPAVRVPCNSGIAAGTVLPRRRQTRGLGRRLAHMPPCRSPASSPEGQQTGGVLAFNIPTYPPRPGSAPQVQPRGPLVGSHAVHVLIDELICPPRMY